VPKAISSKVLGQILKSARTQKRLTQGQAGNLVGMTQAMVSRFECGESNIRIDTLFRLLSALEWELHVNPRAEQTGQGEGDNW